ncbi:MAG: gliding motility-associated C-terminal domain-containing protein [bacterium]
MNIFAKIGIVSIAGIFLSSLLLNASFAVEEDLTDSILVTVTMDINPPVIEHIPERLVNIVGNKIVLSATITEDRELVSAHLFYKAHSASQYNEVDVSLSNVTRHELTVSIPREIVTPDGVDYYITAIDSAGSPGCFSGAGYTRGIPSPVEPIEIEVNPTIVGVTVDSEGGTVALRDANPTDGTTQLVIPKGALSSSKEIVISQIYNVDTVPAGGGAALSKEPVSAYEFIPDKLIFNKPSTLSLLYFDLDSDGYVDGTSVREETLRIFWWDGFAWRYVGGEVDALTNTVTSEIMHFCIYALFPARELAAGDYRPNNKIITPATADGINDVAEFNGLQGKNIEIKIFDVTGKKIRTINSEPYQWDGRNDEERLVEGGVYIYQFEVDGELISGIIAVAK